MRHHSAIIVSALYLLSFTTYIFATSDGERIVQGKLANSINEFALTIYKTIGKSVEGKNVFLSPASISTALAMVYSGAKGETKTQMTSVMHLDVYDYNTTDVKDDFQKLLQTLSNPQNNYTLYTANRLFGQKDYSFRNEFSRDMKAYFQANLEALDFRNDSSGSRAHINDWVAEKTAEKIKDVLPVGSITALTTLVLVNAIYFKGLWSNPFDEKATKPQTFHLSLRQNTQIDMMHLHGKRRLNYFNSVQLGCQIVELPYLGDKSSMLVLLPHNIDGLSSVESRLGAGSLDLIFRGLQSADVKVSLPKFTMDQGVALNDFLKAIGMVNLFDKGKADLSGIDGTRMLFVSSVIHKAFVEVNEEGTEAAGATGVVVSFRSLAPDDSIDFVVDRPFLFLIVEKTSGCILFLGRLTQPPGKNVITN